MAADPGSQQLTWPNEPRCGGGPSGLFVGGVTRKYVISFWLLNKINSNKPECDGCPESADASAQIWQVFRKHWNQIFQHNNSSQFSSWWGPSYCVGWHLDCTVLCKNANKEKKPVTFLCSACIEINSCDLTENSGILQVLASCNTHLFRRTSPRCLQQVFAILEEFSLCLRQACAILRCLQNEGATF